MLPTWPAVFVGKQPADGPLPYYPARVNDSNNSRSRVRSTCFAFCWSWRLLLSLLSVQRWLLLTRRAQAVAVPPPRPLWEWWITSTVRRGRDRMADTGVTKSPTLSPRDGLT